MSKTTNGPREMTLVVGLGWKLRELCPPSTLTKNKIAGNFPAPWYLDGDPVRHLCASPRPGILGEEEEKAARERMAWSHSSLPISCRPLVACPPVVVASSTRRANAGTKPTSLSGMPARSVSLNLGTGPHQCVGLRVPASIHPSLPPSVPPFSEACRGTEYRAPLLPAVRARGMGTRTHTYTRCCIVLTNWPPVDQWGIEMGGQRGEVCTRMHGCPYSRSTNTVIRKRTQSSR